MVKLFVGNLADCIDSDRLTNLFLQHLNVVTECDVLKNFAFVHVVSEEDADLAIQKFDKYRLEGKELHVQRSTSHLRKLPGMSDKCFTCGNEDHKTSQCPKNPNSRKRSNSRSSSNHQHNELLIKKPKPLIFTQPAEEFHLTTQQQQQCWGYKVGAAVNETDSELPCPQNPELHRLYEQYLESRTRYFFYREQLTKELRLQPQTQQQTSLTPGVGFPISISGEPEIGADHFRVDLTKLVRQPPTAPPSVLGSIGSRNLLLSHHPQMEPQFNNSNSATTLYSISSGSQPTTDTYMNTIKQEFGSYSNIPPSFAVGATVKQEFVGNYSNAMTEPASQATYSGTATHYNFPRQHNHIRTAALIPNKHPTPLAAVQPFGYTISK